MKTAILLLSTLFSLHAIEITLTAQQERDWQIITKLPVISEVTPSSTLLVEVVTPPQLLHTLSLPNDVSVTKLHVNLYDTIKKGDALISVSSPQWLEAQKSAISSSINYSDALAVDRRKQLLCREQIIAQKECITSQSALLNAKNSLKASKELLSAYGANNSTIDAITSKFKVFSSLTLKSSVDGNIIESHAAIGKSFAAFESLLVIKQHGDLWLKGALSVKDSSNFRVNDSVTLNIDTKSFDSKVINLAPVINVKNQT
ncbi:MAG: efflux RND transporter periplasmic adaptor subunit [Campylobacterota bacterium]|nr:efflux RND transporter periplasmic adaptor subunit [Campylobacterota bacterium]